jgi:hypothetical protein
MSDYLGNLLVRSFIPGVGVQPRVPSLFDPQPFSDQLATPFEPEVQAVITNEPDATQPRLQRAAAPNAPPVVPLEPAGSDSKRPSRKRAETADRAGKPADLPSDPAPAALERPAPYLPARPASSLVAANPVRPASPAESPAQKTFSEKAADLKRLDSRLERSPAGDRESIVSRSPADGSWSQAAPEARGIAGQSPEEARPAEVQRMERPVQPRTTAIRPTPLALPQSPAKQAPLTTPAPAINITIGRVEVRAVQPSSPARSKVKTPSILSLNDYLEGRSRERRR